MQAYYGSAMGGSRHVLCHALRVEGYTRRLPNGKVIQVNGYTSSRNAAVEGPTRSSTGSRSTGNPSIRAARDRVTMNRISGGASRFRTAAGKAGTAVSATVRNGGSLGGMAQYANRYVAPQVSEMARGAGEAVGGAAQLVSDKIRDVLSDGYDAFKNAISNIGTAIGKAFAAGKSFLDGIFKKVSTAALRIGGQVSRAIAPKKSKSLPGVAVRNPQTLPTTPKKRTNTGGNQYIK